MDHLGYGRALKLIKALPNGPQPVPVKMPQDDLGKVGFPGRQFLVRQRA